MVGQYHIGNAVRNDCVGMICSIIEKLMYLVHGVLCRNRLLWCNGSKCQEHCGINGSGVVEKGSSDLLDEFLLCRCQEW